MVYNIVIDKQIGQGNWWSYGYSKQNLREDLKSLSNKHVDILISSPGGDVDDAIDMYQQLRDHGDVTVYIDGFTASAATIVAMGAKEIKMNKYSYMLIHKCSSTVNAWNNYNADELQQLIEELKKQKCTQDKIDNGIAAIYADRCKKKCEDIKTLLDAADWLTASECRDNGLIDSIIDGDPVVVDSSMSRIVASAGYPQLPISMQDGSNLSNLIDKIGSMIANAFTSKNSPKENTTNSTNNMHKKFKFVSKLLNVDGFDFDDSKKATITDDQLTAVENEIDSLHTKADEDKKTIDSLNAKADEDKKTIDSLNERIAALEAAPGDEISHRTEDNNGDNNAVTANSMFNAVKDFI